MLKPAAHFSVDSSIADPRSAGVDACVGILLAAGHGRRYAAMAPGHNKLMASLEDGVRVIQASAATLRQATARTVAVIRAQQSELRDVLESLGCEWLVVDAEANGMGDSLAAAARHLLATGAPHEQACLVALADMPWLRASTCQQVAAAAVQHAIVVPTWQRRRGHPVAFSRTLWKELAALGGDTGARALLARHPVHELALDDPGVLADVDTPQDLRR